MDELDKIESELLEVQSGLKGFLVRDWAYIAMLFFALLGVALTTVERELMSFYWLILVPVFGFICVIESWRRLKNSGTADHARQGSGASLGVGHLRNAAGFLPEICATR